MPKFYITETVYYTVEGETKEKAYKKFLEAGSVERDQWVDHVEDRSIEDEDGNVEEAS